MNNPDKKGVSEPPGKKPRAEAAGAALFVA